MPTTQWHGNPGIVQQLLDEPYRFEFVQAVRLLERLLLQQGVSRSAVLRDYLQFQSSSSLSFPASEVESLQAEADGVASTEAQLLAALADGKLDRIRMTPAFIGLLGSQGALPLHYSERIAAHEHAYHDGAPRAWLDMFSNRMVALFYLAWRKHRLEYPRDEGQDRLLPLLLSLSGSGARAVPDAVAGYYAAAFRQRPVSAAMMERVLTEYAGVPVTVIPNLGRWHVLAEDQTTTLCQQNPTLNAGAMLGRRLWRRDLVVGLRLGPLSWPQHNHFLKDGPGAASLRHILQMFNTPTLQYEVQLVLHAADVLPARLSGRDGPRLGMNCVLQKPPVTADWAGTRYLIKIE